MPTRRKCLARVAAVGAAPAFLSAAHVDERFTIGMVGFRGRGRQLL